MYYGDKRDSLVLIQKVLRLSNWSIYGYKEDRSDFQSDYFDPAHWNGIAAKNGFILVIDNMTGGEIGGSFIQKSYDFKILKKIEKLEALVACPSAAQGERDNANSRIEALKAKAEITDVVNTGIEKFTYQGNPGNSKWHIEKDGRILAKGTGVFKFHVIQYEFKFREENRYFYTQDEQWNYDVGYTIDTELRGSSYECPWATMYNNDFNYWKDSVLKERAKKAKMMDQLFGLVDKFDKVATIKLGDSDDESLVKQLKHKTTTYYVAVDSDIPTQYVRVGDKWKRYSGLEKNLIYKIEKSGENFSKKKLTKKWHTFKDTEDHIATYKPEPNGSTKVSGFYGSDDDFKNGDIVYVKLEEKIETFTEEVWVKPKQSKSTIRKSKIKKTEAVKKENKQPILSEPIQVESDLREHPNVVLLREGRLFDFRRTDNGQIEKVVAIDVDIAFKEVNAFFKKEKIAYYSTFTKGFILKEKGIELLDVITKDEEPKRDINDEATLWFLKMCQHLGMNKPYNTNVIIDFIVEDVEASADLGKFHDGDFGIAFRRFLEIQASTVEAA